jgi:hypothetical protein
MDNPPAAKQKQVASTESHKQGKAGQSDRRFVAYKSANRKISHPAAICASASAAYIRGLGELLP